MKIHHLAEIFPAMTKPEFERLVQSIAESGLLNPITLLDGEILDGRNRLRACEELGIEPTYVQWDARCGISPLEWVVAENLHRRQLTKGQRAALAVELEPRLAEAARERQAQAGRDRWNSLPSPEGKLSNRHKTSAAAIAGSQFGVGESSVYRLKAVRQRDERVFERVKAGDIGIERAGELVGLPATGQGPRRVPKQKLGEALLPLQRFLRHWDEGQLYGVTPSQARKLLKQVQEIDAVLLEVERALEERTVVSRALS